MRLFFKCLLGGCIGLAALPVFAQETLINARFTAGDLNCLILLDSRRARDSSILTSPDNPSLLAKLPPDYRVESDNTVLLTQYKNEIILFDTGNGAAARGLLMSALKEAGISPEKITGIFITHMHGDHIGGLLLDGKPAFPNAVIYVPKEEAAYWLPESIETVPEGQRGRLESGIRIFKTLAETGQKIVFFESGSNMKPYFGKGVFAFESRPAFGHTPGHTVYTLSSGGVTVLDWGDILHVIDPQLAFPDISATYDMDTSQAAVERKKLLDYAAKNAVIVTGTHTVYPAVFRLQRDGAHGFRKLPLQQN